MPTVPEVAAVVAGNLHLDPADAMVEEATFAAWRYVQLQTGHETADDTPSVEVPNDPIVTQGLIGFARALYVDSIASRGQQVAVADTVLDNVFTPEDIWRHWHHFFTHRNVSWGIA